jgi:Skp family chaperone for outer membrane proteins
MLFYVGSMIRWYAGFRSRHSELSRRTSETVDRKRLDVQNDTAAIKHYYDIIEQFQHLPPEQIYAADETGIDGDGARRKDCLAPKGARRVFTRCASQRCREHTSILNICNAAGTCLPPAFVFKGDPARIDPRIISQLPTDSRYAQQVNGYFLKSHFIGVLEHLVAHASTARPLLLVIDGAKTHVSATALDYAIANNIHIVCLPAHSSHIVQVADLGLFGPLKHYWKKGCEALKIQRQRDNVPQKSLTRLDIVPVFMEAWYKAMTKENIKSAFMKSGIYPFDRTTYLKNSKTGELEDVPCILSMIQYNLSLHPILINEIPCHVRPLLSHVDPPPPDIPPEADKCDKCGSNLKKKREQQFTNTKDGLLLTGKESVQMVHQQEQEALDKKQKAAEKKIAAAEKRRIREEKKLKRNSDAMLMNDDDKENRSPNDATASTSTSTTQRNKRQKREHHNNNQISVSDDHNDRTLTSISQRQSSIVLPNGSPVIVSIEIPS